MGREGSWEDGLREGGWRGCVASAVEGWGGGGEKLRG